MQKKKKPTTWDLFLSSSSTGFTRQNWFLKKKQILCFTKDKSIFNWSIRYVQFYSFGDNKVYRWLINQRKRDLWLINLIALGHILIVIIKWQTPKTTSILLLDSPCPSSPSSTWAASVKGHELHPGPCALILGQPRDPTCTEKCS